MRTFSSTEFGTVIIQPTTYYDKALCIMLWTGNEQDGMQEPLTKLSANLDGSLKLPRYHFYVKTYSENDQIARDAAKSGWFKPHPEIEDGMSGFVNFPVWELLKEKGEGFEIEG